MSGTRSTDLVPAGYEVLTDTIDLRNVELLNTAEAESPNAAARQLLGSTARVDAAAAGGPASGAVKSDVDSQLLLYVPFLNKVSVHSLLVKAPELSPVETEFQLPKHVKVWANLPTPLGFDEAETQRASFDAPVAVGSGWTVVPLRFVLFQNVNSVQIFINGDDEDVSTVLERIVLVGRKGESRTAGKLQADEE